MQGDLQAIRSMLTDATLASTVQQNVLSRFDALPKLYADLYRTYESRFADRIADLVQVMVRTLTAKDAGADGAELAVAIVTRMRAMHDHYGVGVVLKTLPATKTTPKRKRA